jgi:hypothetical protein
LNFPAIRSFALSILPNTKSMWVRFGVVMKVSQLFVALGVLVAGSSSGFTAENTSDGFNWSGFYIGAYGAYREGTSKSEVAVDAQPSDPFPGIHAGYLTGNVILGLEGDASWADLDDDIRIGPAQVTQDFDNIASVRARIGLPFENTLLFANVGWAWADT